MRALWLTVRSWEVALLPVSWLHAALRPPLWGPIGRSIPLAVVALGLGVCRLHVCEQILRASGVLKRGYRCMQDLCQARRCTRRARERTLAMMQGQYLLHA